MAMLFLQQLVTIILLSSYIWKNKVIASSNSITKLDVPAWIHHGESTQMVCEFDTDLAQLYWSLTDFDNMSPSGNEPLLVLYAFFTSTWSGPALNRTTWSISERSASLSITDVDWHRDEGRYHCVTVDSINYATSYASSVALVSVSPILELLNGSGHILINGSTVSLIQGTEFTFTCQAIGSKPLANITWVLGDNPGDTVTNLPQTETPNVVEGLWDTSNTLTIIPDVPHHNKRLQCVTSVPAGPIIVSFVTLQVQATQVDIIVTKSIVGPILEGSNITLTCAVDGSLTSKTFLWYEADILIENDNQRQEILFLGNIEKKHAGYYRCGVQHALPPVFYSDYVNIIVHYKPQIANTRNFKIAAKSGDNVSIECLAHGNPSPTITWHYANGDEIEADNKTFDIKTVLGNVAAQAALVRSTLEIINVDPRRDFGVFRCSATNYVGSSSDFIQLTGVAVENNNSLLSLIIGVALSIIFVLVIIAVIVCLCYRRLNVSGNKKGTQKSEVSSKDDGIYEDLDPVTSDSRHPYEQPIPLHLIDKDAKVYYEVPNTEACNVDTKKGDGDNLKEYQELIAAKDGGEAPGNYEALKCVGKYEELETS